MFLKCLRVYIKAILTFYLGLKNKSLPAQEFGFSIYSVPNMLKKCH